MVYHQMKRFEDFVKQHGVKQKNDVYNFVQTRKNAYYYGKYNLKKSFLPKYLKSYTKFGKKFPCLVWKVADRDKFMFYLDFDFESTERIEATSKEFVAIADNVLLTLAVPDKELFVILTKRVSCYKKDKVYKNGFHLYIPNLQVDRKFMRDFKNKFAGQLEGFIKKHNITNNYNDIVDDVAIKRSNGLYMIGTNKPEFSPSPHFIFFASKNRNFCWAGDTDDSIQQFGWEFDKEKHTIFKKLMHLIYDQVFEQDFSRGRSGVKAVVEPKMVAPVPIPVKPVKNEKGRFDLSYFLDCCAGNASKFNRDQWKRLVFFCRIQGLDKDRVCEQLNTFFTPPDLRENESLWDSYRNEKDINCGTVVFFLQYYATKEWDTTRLFPDSHFKYHNESNMFLDCKKTWRLDEVHKYFNEVYAYTFGQGRTMFLYREQRLKRFGKEYRNVVTFVHTKNLPFDSTGDILIKLEPTIEELQDALKSFCEKKCTSQADFRLLEEANKLDTENYDVVDRFLKTQHICLKPKEKSLCALFSNNKKRGGMPQRFYGYDFIPYLTLEQNKCPRDLFNIFTGFAMEPFRNTDIDVKKTRIWRWFWEALCDKNEYKLDYLFSCIAAKIQQPHRKLGKFLVFFSRLCGTGKSSIAKFLSKLLGEEYVLMVSSMKEFLVENNSFLLGKLFVIIDDIERASRAVSDQLKTRISEPTFTMKKLYEDRKTMNCYADLITTSNSRNPVFIASDNRRTELIAVNPCLEMVPTAFWDGFYDIELECPKIMGAWFEFFAAYPIKINVRSKKNRFDVQQLCKQKIESMKIVHKWLINFFQEETCFESTYDKRFMGKDYFAPLKLEMIDKQRFCVVTCDRAYEYFVEWRKQQGTRLNPSKDTFISDLKDAGVTRQRVKITKGSGHTSRKWCFKLCQPFVVKTLCCFYKVGDSFTFNWCFNEKECFERLKKAYHNSEFLFTKTEKYG